MVDFILGAQISCTKSRYTAFHIELKHPLAPLIHCVFAYLLLDQNHKLSRTPKSCVLDVARFLARLI